ncbi:claudin-15 [Protopterus annectens]|uniref:claudin-15 n=1 Tax=Protopterus annectens TaxID=7888 RepID=UPI001CF9D161|nr:claudin-15 [Protopterus annectens]
MTAALEIAGFFMGVAGGVLWAVILPNPYWKVSSVDGNVITTSTLYENLWQSCAMDSTGVSNCREFPSMLALSGYIQACRALLITAILLGFFGIVVSMIGLKCTTVAGDDPVTKGKIATVGGILFILAGICTLIAVTWYAVNITREFFDPLYAGTKYEIGPALYMGWAGSMLAIIGGICLCCSCRTGEVKLQSYNYSYKPRKSTAAASARPSTLKIHDGDINTSYDKNAYV